MQRHRQRVFRIRPTVDLPPGDGDNITNIPVEDAPIGSYRNARLLEPHTYGVIVQKKF